MNNRFEFIGRIAKDLELRTTSNGKKVIDVNMAVRINKDETLFIRPTLFGATAETLNKYCKKGDLISISGFIRNHNWEDDKGKHYDLQFIGTEMLMLQIKKENKEKEENAVIPQNTKTDYQEKEVVVTDEDLPF